MSSIETRDLAGRSITFRHEAGEGPALICIHGSADNQHVYDRLLDALPGHERYAINMPGRAGTDGPPLASAAEMEAFLSDFIRAELKGDYLVVGHSLGGAVALEHALQSSTERLRGIVLLATGARLRVHPLILQLFEQVAKSGTGLPPLPPGLYEKDAEQSLIEEASKHRERTPIETGALDWRAADGFDRLQDLDRVRVPALIVAGSDDALTPPKYAEHLAAEIPQSELHVIDGGGHMLVMERTEELARWIESFVSV